MFRRLAFLSIFIAGCPSHPSTDVHDVALPVVSSVASAPPPPTCTPSRTPPDAERIVMEDAAMGTHVAFAAYTNDHVNASEVRRAFADAIAEIRRVEDLMTTWRPSDITRVNEAAGKSPVPVSRETYDLVAESLHASEISKGAFDITFESLHGLWKFDQDLDPHPPTQAAVAALLPLLDYHHVKLDPKDRTVFLDTKGVRIGLGGIAKGYAVDRASAVLDKECITSFYVQAGGDLFTRGHKPNGDEWQAGIRDPRSDDKQKFFALLGVSDHSFSTAGDYERSYMIDGKRYHHIIDPKTGFPATASRSVTIWAPTALLADEIDDAVFIMGPQDGLALVESIDGVGAVIVDAKNNLWVSKRLHGKLRMTGVPTDAP